ncbi:hypothetical protein [Acinetobacter sp. SA01]|uniref:hypothetical protein n=1 Tax=Acinetobacter sp. SA01 TaxID=1862567 RepID=UPI001408AF87|nr:hypothetical protein [Acinetobacter sp. SA01]
MHIIGIENPSLDLIEKVCINARSNNFTTISEYLTFLVERDCETNEKPNEDEILLIIDSLIQLALKNRRRLDAFTMQELYTFCIKNEEEFDYPNWSSLDRSVRIELGKKFKAAILKHADKIELGDDYIKQDGTNINNSALYKVTRDRVESSRPFRTRL